MKLYDPRLSGSPVMRQWPEQDFRMIVFHYSAVADKIVLHLPVSKNQASMFSKLRILHRTVSPCQRKLHRCSLRPLILLILPHQHSAPEIGVPSGNGRAAARPLISSRITLLIESGYLPFAVGACTSSRHPISDILAEIVPLLA